MKKTAISVTEAARNFAECLNRVHYQQISFVLLKNGKAVAQLIPGDEKVCTGRDAAEALASVKLPPKEVMAWRRDAQAARKILKPPANKR